MVGRTLSHYRVTAKIGAGGMGEVYRATDTKLGREVAIKVLPEELAGDPGRLARFQREAKALALLNHPNIVTVHSVEAEGGVHFLTMELIEGQTLSKSIPAGGLPLRELFAVAVPLAEALAAAHEKGVVHRDLKPGNVMVTGDARVKVLDFGLAKLMEAGPASPIVDSGPTAIVGEALTRQGQLFGTLPYMSPEQLEGREIDHRSDIFSLGAVLYEMATGNRPFAGESLAALTAAILKDDPPTLGAVRSDLPRHLGRIVSHCLQKRRHDRYQSARDVYNELNGLRRELTAEELTATSASRQQARRRRRRAPWAALVVAVLAAGLYWLGPWRPERPAPSERGGQIAVLPFEVHGDPELGYLREGIVGLLSTKLDGAGDLHSLDPHTLLSYVQRDLGDAVDPASATRAAERFGAAYFVVGDVVAASGRILVSASLYRTGSGEILSKASAEGDADQVFDVLDDLATELVTEQVSGPEAQFTRVAALTTDSLPALKVYLRGENEMRRGHFTAAVDSFQKAVAIDPSFALAWYRLGVAAEWGLRPDVSDVATAEAAKLSDRLSERYQALLAARLANRGGDPEEAERRYRAILGSYPTDIEALSQLGEVLSHYSYRSGRSQTVSREAWGRLLELEPEHVGALWHLVRVAAVEGNRTELEDIRRRILALNPDADRLVEINTLVAFATGDATLRRQVMSDLGQASDVLVTLSAWNVALATDNLAGCRAVVEVLTEPHRSTPARALGFSILAYLDLAQGRWRTAREQLARAEAVSPYLALEHGALLAAMPFVPVERPELERRRAALEAWDATQVPPSAIVSNFYSQDDGIHPLIRLYLLGLIEARLGSGEALARAEQLLALEGQDKVRTLAANFAHAVRARWHAEQGRPPEALAELAAIRITTNYQDVYASPFYSEALERYERAELLIALGRPAEALPWLASFAEVSYFDELYLAPAAFQRARALEALGREDEARTADRRFLDVWSSADPDLQSSWVDEARARKEAGR